MDEDNWSLLEFLIDDSNTTVPLDDHGTNNFSNKQNFQQQFFRRLNSLLKDHQEKTRHYNIHSVMVGVTGSVLSYMVITYGLIPALNWYKKLSFKSPQKGITIKNIEELLKFKKHTPIHLPSLSSDMSIIVRIINDKGVPQPIMDDYEEETGSIPARLQNVWEIIGDTVASNVTELQPTLIPNMKGTLSFVTIPIPQSKDLISELQNKLKANHFIPISTPHRGPLAHKSFLTFDTSLVEDKIHPELLITVIF